MTTLGFDYTQIVGSIEQVRIESQSTPVQISSLPNRAIALLNVSQSGQDFGVIWILTRSRAQQHFSMWLGSSESGAGQRLPRQRKIANIVLGFDRIRKRQQCD